VIGEGQASRTNHASRGSFGAGRVRPPRARTMDADQPVAPVPVETISPEEGLAFGLPVRSRESVPGRLVGGVPDEDARVDVRFGVDSDDGLAVEVFGGVGHESVLADDGDDVLGGEEEAAEVVAFDVGASPFGRDRGADGCQGPGEPVVVALDVLDGAASGAEEEFGLAAGGVPVQEFLQFGAPVDDDQAGPCRAFPRRNRCRTCPASPTRFASPRH
jgi:hypothetical protein